MAALDTSIVNVALPHMRGALDASVEEIAWVSTGYILSSVIVMPIIALLSSRFGRKRFFSFLGHPLHKLFDAVRGCLIPAFDDRLPCPPGHRPWDPHTPGTGLAAPDVSGQRTGNGDEHLRSRRHPRARLRADPRRMAHRQLLMALDILYQCPRRHPQRPAHHALRRRPPLPRPGKGSIDATGLFLMAVGLGSLQVMLEKGDQKDWFTSDMIRYLAAAALAGLILFVIREAES